MNKRIVFPLLFLSLCNLLVFAQSSDSDLYGSQGVSIGIEKNDAVWIDYGFNSDIHLSFRHSLFPDELDSQYWQINECSYITIGNNILMVSPFVLSDWSLSFANYGCILRTSSLLMNKKIKIGIEYVPDYDTNLKFQQGWSLSALGSISSNISLFAEYGRKRDYRMAIKRGYVGLEIKVNNLIVKPMLEVPFYDTGLQLNHSRVVISTFFTLPNLKNK